MTKQEIKRYAEMFCEDHNVNTYPVPIVSLCRKLKIQVFQKYLPSHVSGFIVIQKEPFQDCETGRVIVVNLSDSAARQRFTIAHELAHYVLHREENSELYAHRDAGETGGIEQEANIFASNVLMPEELVKDALEKNGNPLNRQIQVEIIAQEFAVSRDAANVRLNQLGKK